MGPWLVDIPVLLTFSPPPHVFSFKGANKQVVTIMEQIDEEHGNWVCSFSLLPLPFIP
jgi:hypothetical protein